MYTCACVLYLCGCLVDDFVVFKLRIYCTNTNIIFIIPNRNLPKQKMRKKKQLKPFKRYLWHLVDITVKL